MDLKRIFKKNEAGENELDQHGQPILDHIKVLRHSKKQNFTQKKIDQGVTDGFMTLSKGQIILHAKPADLIYKIIRAPGYYCCFDNSKHGGEAEARQYTKDKYAGEVCDDSNNPAGYRKDNFFHCEIQETN